MADLCVASETTRFIYPEGKIGTTAGGVSSVMARMPHKIAMEFLLVGEEMSAERAWQIGFVNKVAPKGQHVAIAQEMAAKIAGNAPLVVRSKPSPTCGGCSMKSGTARISGKASRRSPRSGRQDLLGNNFLVIPAWPKGQGPESILTARAWPLGHSRQ
jgi:enoyl-CoA hydratase/carnithine racemase